MLTENCTVEHVDNTGIYTWSDFSPHPRDPQWEQLRFTHVVIRGNTITETGKNAIGVRASLAPLIERNVAVVEDGGSYLWAGATNVVFENNSFLGRQPNNAPPSGDFQYYPSVLFARKGEIELRADLCIPICVLPLDKRAGLY